MKRRVSVFKKKKNKERKKREKSASPSGVIFEPGSVHRWVGYVSPRAFARSTKFDPNQTNTPLQNRHRNKTLVHLTIFFLLFSRLNKKKKRLLKLSSRGTGRAELNAARRCTRSTSVLVLRTELVAKDFGLANEPAF